MKTPSLVVHIPPSGAPVVVLCTQDADAAIKAYRACNQTGEVMLFAKPRTDRRKVIKVADAAAKAATPAPASPRKPGK